MYFSSYAEVFDILGLNGFGIDVWAQGANLGWDLVAVMNMGGKEPPTPPPQVLKPFKFRQRAEHEHILEESVTLLEDKLLRDFQYLQVNIGCKLPIK